MNCRFATGLLLLAAASGTAAPVPKDPEVVYYFATTPGARWVYQRPDGDDEVVTISRVEKVEDAKNEVIVSRVGPNESPSQYLKVWVSADGLRQPKNGDEAETEWVLKTRVRPGDSWEYGRVKRTVHGPDEIEVPAGKFRALRVSWETESGKHTSWYAPNVGELKRVTKRGDEKEITTRLLKSFTPK